MELQITGKKAWAYSGGKIFDSKLPSVVFIHGGALDHSVWILQSRYLAHHGYSVLAVDLPGHGRSEGPPLARIEDMADRIAALLDAVGAKTASLVGHSMGSLIALECAARFPERVNRIALLGTAFPMRVSSELLDAARDNEPAAHRMINTWSHSAAAHYPNNPGPGHWLIGANLRLMQRQNPGVLYTDFSACNDYAAGVERAALVRCPALLLLGEQDQMTPPRQGRELGKAISGARVVTLERCGHNLMGEKPDEVLDTLVEFLRDSS